LLRRTRQLLHSQAADALISRSEKDASARAEVIAHHLQFAGRSGEAITYWRKAGERAVQQAANREAVGHLRRALSLLEVQPETAGRRRAELAILLQLGPALMSLHRSRICGVSISLAGATIEPKRIRVTSFELHVSSTTLKSCCRRTIPHKEIWSFAANSRQPASISMRRCCSTMRSATPITATSISGTIQVFACWL